MTDTLAALKAGWATRSSWGAWEFPPFVERLLAVAEGLERERDDMHHAADDNWASRERTAVERDALRAANGRLRVALQDILRWVPNPRLPIPFEDARAIHAAAQVALAQDDAPQGG